MRYDPDAEEYGAGLFGRILAATPGSGPAATELTRLLDRDARAMVDLATSRAAAHGSPTTGTDDLIWAACHTQRATAVLQMCGVDSADVLRMLPDTAPAGRPATNTPPLTRGLRRVLMVADYVAHQSGVARPGLSHLTIALLVEQSTRAYQIVNGSHTQVSHE